MSNEIEAIKDPGLPAHVHRRADTDPKAAAKAERQVAILFLLSARGTLTLIGAYFFIPQDAFIFFPVLGNTNAHQLFLGLGMAASLFFIGMGAIHWAKTLMPDEEVIIQRHEFRSEDEDRAGLIATAKAGAAAAGLGRRSLIKRSLGRSLGLSFYVFNECSHAWFDSVKNWFWIDARYDDDCDKHRHQQAFTNRNFFKSRIGFVWLTVEYALISPQQIKRGKNDTDSGDNCPPASRTK